MRKWAGKESGNKEEKKSIEETSSFFWLKGSKIMLLSKSAQIEGKGCDCGK